MLFIPVPTYSAWAKARIFSMRGQMIILYRIATLYAIRWAAYMHAAVETLAFREFRAINTIFREDAGRDGTTSGQDYGLPHALCACLTINNRRRLRRRLPRRIDAFDTDNISSRHSAFSRRHAAAYRHRSSSKLWRGFCYGELRYRHISAHYAPIVENGDGRIHQHAGRNRRGAMTILL